MSPTIQPGDWVLLFRTSAPVPLIEPFELARGDLVVLNVSRERNGLLKRVVAVSGDRVFIKEGLLFINGTPVYESYATYVDSYHREADRWPLGGQREIIVPPGMVFVLGDNRSEALDSRAWGPVALSGIVGKVLLRLPI